MIASASFSREPLRRVAVRHERVLGGFDQVPQALRDREVGFRPQPGQVVSFDISLWCTLVNLFLDDKDNLQWFPTIRTLRKLMDNASSDRIRASLQRLVDAEALDLGSHSGSGRRVGAVVYVLDYAPRLQREHTDQPQPPAARPSGTVVRGPNDYPEADADRERTRSFCAKERTGSRYTSEPDSGTQMTPHPFNPEESDVNLESLLPPPVAVVDFDEFDETDFERRTMSKERRPRQARRAPRPRKPDRKPTIRPETEVEREIWERLIGFGIAAPQKALAGLRARGLVSLEHLERLLSHAAAPNIRTPQNFVVWMCEEGFTPPKPKETGSRVLTNDDYRDQSRPWCSDDGEGVDQAHEDEPDAPNDAQAEQIAADDGMFTPGDAHDGTEQADSDGPPSLPTTPKARVALWRRVLLAVRPAVSPDDFAGWLEPLVLAEITPGWAGVVVSDVFARTEIESRFLELLQTALSEIVGETMEITVGIGHGGWR